MNQPTSPADVLGAFSTGLADAVDRVRPALVLVNGRQRQPASGVVIESDLVLTADHVLEREDDLSVITDDGRTLPAQFLGRDTASDLALLRVANLNAPAAVTADAARVGQIVLAVGRPAPGGPMASLGIVSAVGGPLRTTRGAMVEHVIQTDATPYPGFSGGPLLDASGAVLGITTTGLINGVALAVPASIAWRIADTIKHQGFVRRGFLGISSQPVAIPATQRAGRSQEQGLLVVRVEEGSPAAQSGMLLGDILVGFDGQVLSDTDQLQGLLSGERVGRPVQAEVIRGGNMVTLSVTVGQRK